MHYYKLQHVFFATYHSTHPVYASWGPLKNPDILKEPGATGGINNGAKEFAVRGAAKRARRRMGTVEDDGSVAVVAAAAVPEVCRTSVALLIAH